MADDFSPPAAKKTTAAGSSYPTPSPASAASKPILKAQPMTDTLSSTTSDETFANGNGAEAHRSEAKTRFSAAVTEARAGASALKAEATERAGVYREQAGKRGEDLMTDAKAYGEEAKIKGRDLAAQGKGKVSEGLTALGQAVADSAHVVDEKLGAKYGDYARTASRSLQDTAIRIDQKSVDELGEDARSFVRKSPGAAVGIAAVIGFLLSRLFSGPRR